VPPSSLRRARQYDHDNAAALAALGIPAFACTPGLFGELMAAATERRDITARAGERGLVTQRLVEGRGTAR
jgi:non-ribosomal peptide synthetase component F